MLPSSPTPRVGHATARTAVRLKERSATDRVTRDPHLPSAPRRCAMGSKYGASSAELTARLETPTLVRALIYQHATDDGDGAPRMISPSLPLRVKLHLPSTWQYVGGPKGSPVGWPRCRIPLTLSPASWEACRSIAGTVKNRDFLVRGVAGRRAPRVVQSANSSPSGCCRDASWRRSGGRRWRG